MNIVARLKKFFQDARQEWRHVNWPTRTQAMYLTGVVIGLTLILAALMGAFDYFFLRLLQLIIE